MTLISPSCWVVTHGVPGVENQCLGVAEALGLTPTLKRITLRAPWRQLSPFLRWGLRHALSAEGDRLAPPWPDLLIASGRASVLASLYVRQESRRAGGRGTFTVQIQNPVIDPSHFDLVVVPRHDLLNGPNVLSTTGSLHRVTPQRLVQEAEKFASAFAPFKPPYHVVLFGGSNAVYKLTRKEMTVLAAQLRAVAAQGGSLLITASRRTGEENLRILQEALQGLPAFIWDGTGPNPYYAMLHMADILLVTCDSVNLVSEACATGKPVMILDLPGGSDKFRRFHQALHEDGLTRPFKGAVERWHPKPLEDVQRVADRIRGMRGLGNN